MWSFPSGSRTLPSENSASVEKELRGILDAIASDDAEFAFTVVAGLERNPFSVDRNEAVVTSLIAAVAQHSGAEPQCAASHFGPTAHSYLMRVSPPCCSGWTVGEPAQPKNGSPSIRSSPSPKHSKKSSPTSPIRAPVRAFTEMLNSTDVDRRVPRPRPNVYCGRSPLSRCYRADLPGAPP